MRAKLVWFTCLLTISLMLGCDGNRHLVGIDSDRGVGSGTGGTGGNSGSIGSGTGASGPAGKGGTAGSGGSSSSGGVGAGAGASTGAAPGPALGAGATGNSGAVPGSPGGAAGLGPIGGAAGAIGGPPTPRPLSTTPRKAVYAVSRLLWQSTPDLPLLTKADSGALATSEDIRALALRMMTDARAETGVGDFYRWWLDLDQVAALGANGQAKDPTLFPQFNADLSSSMASETQIFGSYVTLDGDGLFSTLLTAPFTFVNQALAAVYNVDGVTGTVLRRVALDPSERAGLLTQPGILALYTHGAVTAPVQRGYFWNEKLLCQMVPPPPANVPPLPVTSPFSTATTRQLLDQHRANPACAGCHSLLDPVGIALEHFDAIGQFRETENGLMIDTSSVLQTPSGGAVFFDGAPQLAAVLASSPDAQQCMARQWLAYAVGRSLTAQDDAVVAAVLAPFSASGFNLRELIAAVTATDLFLSHTPACTPGADQTCNDDPTISSVRGHCTEGQRCVCTLTNVNPETGRCY